MPTGTRNDPLSAFNFVVQLIDSDGSLRTVAGFSECSGLESTLEIQEYKEGGVNDRVRRFPSRFMFANLVLKHGITTDDSLRKWHGELLKGNTRRRDGLITLMNEAGEPVLAWKFERGLPVKWSGPALNAAQSSVGIETLEIAVEHLDAFDL
jgi:phage tail-like protein